MEWFGEEFVLVRCDTHRQACYKNCSAKHGGNTFARSIFEASIFYKLPKGYFGKRIASKVLVITGF